MVVLNTLSIIVISVLVILLLWVTYKLGLSKKQQEWQEKLNSLRKEIADKQRSGIKGKVTEMFAPYLEGFPVKASECKFLGDPIDYVAFEGLDDCDIKRIHFIDVKADTSELKKHQRQIKELVESNPNMSFTTFKFKTK